MATQWVTQWVSKKEPKQNPARKLPNPHTPKSKSITKQALLSRTSPRKAGPPAQGAPAC